MEIPVTELKFAVNADPEKVWDLIGRAIFDSLGQGLSKMKVLDENNFRAELKIKVFGLIPMTMSLRGEMTDITPPDRLGVTLTVKGMGNLVNMVQKVNIAMKVVAEGQTEVHCKAAVEGLNPLVRWLLLGQVKKQASGIFQGIEKCLKQWV